MSGENKPELANISLDDIISAENKAKKQKKRKNAQTQPQNVNFDDFTDEQIRAQLASRGLSTKGGRQKLVNRLKAEVQRAWAQFKKANKNNIIPGLMPPIDISKPKKPKKKLTEEERNKIHAQNEANRLAKAKRRVENLKRQEENQRRKRQKREENAEKQRKLKAQQKIAKEARQRCELFVQFDLDSYKEALRKKLDPTATKIISLTQDFSKKGFVAKFKSAKDAQACTKGSTMKKKKMIKATVMASIIASPVECNTVFFLYPLDQNHPDLAKAKAWTLTQNSDDKLTELKKLDIWIKSALTHFSKNGVVNHIYRERGFLVINFSTESAAKKCLTANESGDFNGVKFHYMKMGTPTKADCLECLKLCKTNGVKTE
jgi:hypothetical protein